MGTEVLELRTQVCFWAAIEALAVRRAQSARDRISFKELMNKEYLAKLRVEDKAVKSGVTVPDIR